MIALKTINDIDPTNENITYKSQQYLTSKLDNFDWDFSQDIINNIVLWKVCRFVRFEKHTLDYLNKIDKKSTMIDRKFTFQCLMLLLKTKWIQISMASTILRFKNPSVYQILDQRVYRFIYWMPLNTNWLKIEEIIFLYLDYLDKLQLVCQEKGVKFEDSGRILYALDKKFNKNIKVD